MIVAVRSASGVFEERDVDEERVARVATEIATKAANLYWATGHSVGDLSAIDWLFEAYGYVVRTELLGVVRLRGDFLDRVVRETERHID